RPNVRPAPPRHPRESGRSLADARPWHPQCLGGPRAFLRGRRTRTRSSASASGHRSPGEPVARGGKGYLFAILYISPDDKYRPDRRMADFITVVLKNVPLVSAGAWLVLAALQVYRDRWHTWTETFFLFACFFAGLYAIGDWLFFHAKPEWAGFAALISFTGLTLAVNFFLLFTLVYVDRMRRSYWALMVVSIAMLLLVFRFGITMMNPPTSDAPLFVPVFDFRILGIYLVYVLTYTV